MLNFKIKLKFQFICFLVFLIFLLLFSNFLIGKIGFKKIERAQARVEIISKRNKYTKTYLNPDGSYTAEISIAPIHYYDYQKQRWEPISLKAKKKKSKLIIDKNTVDLEAGDDKRTKNVFELVKFWINKEEKGKVKQEWIKISFPLSNNKRINLKSQPIEEKPGTLFWSKIYPDIDFRLVINEKGVIRESFILKNKNALESWVNEMSRLLIETNLQVKKEGSLINFYNQEKRVFYFTEPYLKAIFSQEEKTKYNSDVIYYQLKPAEKAGKFYLEKILEEKGRKWIEEQFNQGALEVEIDPTLSLQPGPSDGECADIGYWYGGDYNAGAWNIVEISWSSSLQSYTSGLFRFDLSSIPLGCSIISSTLTVTQGCWSGRCVDPGAGNYIPIVPHRVLRDWNEGNKSWQAASTGEVTWNSARYNQESWTTSGAKNVGTDIASQEDPDGITEYNCCTDGTTYDIDLTTSTQTIIDGASNYGWILKRNDVTSGSYQTFAIHSDDSSTASYRPKLVVVYEVDNYSWGENVGWQNWKPKYSGTDYGVTVYDECLTGYVWNENIGWIKLGDTSCTGGDCCQSGTSKGYENDSNGTDDDGDGVADDWGVNNDGDGNLSGYAWGENVGWINFKDTSGNDYNQVVINNDGEFTDYAWGENIGWINMNCSNDSSCSTVDFKVKTDWIPSQPPTVTNVQLNNQNDINLTENTTTSVSATATITDPNGYDDINTVTAKIYKSSVSGGKDCTPNDNNCYSVSSCSLSGCSGNSCTATCTINMQFHADPTDGSTDYWRAWIQATDDESQTGSGYSPADAPDVNSLKALDVSSWLSGWQYRKKITITGQSGAGTDYQIKLKVGESSGASGANFHLEGHSSNFPSNSNQSGDLRFTDDDGTTQLDFWVEKVDGTSPNRVATVWVEVKDNLDSNVDIYCYYGNSSAGNVSSGDDTFVFFDDFEESSLKSGWTFWNPGGDDSYSLTERSGWMRIKVIGDSDTWSSINNAPFVYWTHPNPNSNFIVETKEDGSGVASGRHSLLAYIRSFSTGSQNKGYWGAYNSTTSCKFEADGYRGSTCNTGVTTHYTRFRKVGSTLYYDWSTDGESWNNCSSYSLPSIPSYWGLGGKSWGGGGSFNADFDYFIVRKYTSTEPSFNSAGSEETSSGADIDYGNVAAGTNTGSTNQQTTITNTGNVDIDVRLSGTDMTSGSNSIDASKQKYSETSFTYDSGGTSLKEDPNYDDVNLDLDKPTTAPSDSSDVLYWGLEVPTGTPAGNYSGSISFTAIDAL